MWLIFLLFALGFSIVGLIVVWLGNKIINAMKKDNYKTEQELKMKQKENE